MSEYYVTRPGGDKIGPMSLEEIQAKCNKGELTSDYLIWCDGMPDWKPISSLVSQVPTPVVAGWNLLNALTSCIKRYCQFSGRASRSEYWWYVLAQALVSWVLMLIFSVLLPESAGNFLSTLVALFFFLPSLAVFFRRLHDTGRSGWWILLGLIPFIGAVVLLIFTILPSEGANKYGEAPAGPVA